MREHADPNLTCIVAGNKVDLCDTEGGGKQREVTAEEGEAFAKEQGLLFVESSAKSGQNVELAFFTASRDILDKVKRGVFDQGKVRHDDHHLLLCPGLTKASITEYASFCLGPWVNVRALQSPGVKPAKMGNNNNALSLDTPRTKQGCCS